MKPENFHLLIVDDDEAVRRALQVNLRKQGYQLSICSNPSDAIELIQRRPVDLVLTDVRMPGMSGLVFLEQVKMSQPELPFVVMTGDGNVEDAVKAMRLGAADYLTKPVAKEVLRLVVARCLENRALRNELSRLRLEIHGQRDPGHMIGQSLIMKELSEDIRSIAPTSATVLLCGPTGTGKELIAHALHAQSARPTGPFIRVNCCAIPDSLLETELFGHEKGAFTGAARQHLGKFEQADGGTLLLDEIGEIGPQMQAKLLRVLEVGEFQRVGGTETIQVDVRVIASTNRDLKEEVERGRFRSDLYYRLNVLRLTVPALRDRPGDIGLLVDHFLKKYCDENQTPLPILTPHTLSQLKQYHWPGNVRELRHLIERSVIMSRGKVFQIELPACGPNEEKKAEAPATPSLVSALHHLERTLIIDALQSNDGVQAKAAQALGLSRSNLAYRIKKLGIRLKKLSYE